jgi:hypothetical protein
VQGNGGQGSDRQVDDEFDMSDGMWEAEKEYMADAERAWDFEERHPELRAVPNRDIDPMWFSKPVNTITRATDGPAAAEFVKDINSRVVRPSPHQNLPLRQDAVS